MVMRRESVARTRTDVSAESPEAASTSCRVPVEDGAVSTAKDFCVLAWMRRVLSVTASI